MFQRLTTIVLAIAVVGSACSASLARGHGGGHHSYGGGHHSYGGGHHSYGGGHRSYGGRHSWSGRIYGFRTSKCKSASCFRKHPNGTYVHPLTERKHR